MAAASKKKNHSSPQVKSLHVEIDSDLHSRFEAFVKNETLGGTNRRVVETALKEFLDSREKKI